MLFEKNKFPTQSIRDFDQNFISDLNDGEIYREFLQKENPNRLNDCYTFTLNTDGINLCEKSNLSCWPVYLVCNEFDIENRYCPDNIIIAGKIFKR